MSAPPRSRRELTQLELAITTILIVAFVWATIHKLTALEAAAEHASFTATVNRIKSALMVEALTRLVRDEGAALTALEGLNPMELMARAPFNYAGVVDSPAGLASGVWYYDDSRIRLVYTFHHVPRDADGRATEARRQFRVRVLYSDRNADGVFGPGADEFAGVTLEPIAGSSPGTAN